MPTELSDLLEPSTTAVLTCEVQRGIVGDLSIDPTLQNAAAESGLIAAAQRVVVAARKAGVRVVHNTYGFRPDRAGIVVNNAMMAAALKHGRFLITGTEQVEVVPELGPEPEDIVSHRIHGYTPFPGTGLDAILRNLGIRTVVPVGLSLNECVMGTCISAADLGYRIVIPREAVLGIPHEYGEMVLKYSLSLIATISTVDDVVNTLLSYP